MGIVRRSFGVATLLLSILGLTVCLAGIVGVWMVKSRVEAVGEAVLGAADDSLAFVDEKLDRVKQILNKSQEPVSLLARAAERLHRQEPEAKKEVTSLLQTLDEEVFQELKSAQSWLDSAHALAVGMGRVSETLVSSEYAASHQDTVGMATALRLQESSESVADILAKLQVLREELVQLRDKAVVAREVAARIVARLVDLETKLDHLASRIEKLDVRVAETRDDVGDLKQSVPWWTTAVALVLTLLPVWFAVSQIVMAQQGWRLIREALNS
jgi:chromosome segregation ATPase